MSIDKHLNLEYNATTPLIVGDRNWASDIVRDMQYQRDVAGLIMASAMNMPCILFGGVVTKGTGDTLNITDGEGFTSLTVDIPDTFATIPPSKTTGAISACRVKWTAQTDLAIAGATLDGGTPNYVKIAYHDADGNTRSRAITGGAAYAYEQTPSFTITVNSSAPAVGSDEIVLCTFTGTAGGAFTFSTALRTKSFTNFITGKTYENLLVKCAAAHPTYQLTVTWDKLYIEGWMSISGSFTVDITASGALGLDTGSEASSTWYYLWAIAKTDGTTSCLLSASSTAPTLPSGYTRKRLISMVRNSSGSDFINFVQQDKNYSYVDWELVVSSTGDVNPAAAQDARGQIPETVSRVRVVYQHTAMDAGGGSSVTNKIYDYINSTYCESHQNQASSSAAAAFAYSYINVYVVTYNRYIQIYATTTGAATVNAYQLYLIGFDVEL